MTDISRDVSKNLPIPPVLKSSDFDLHISCVQGWRSCYCTARFVDNIMLKSICASAYLSFQRNIEKM